MGRLEHDLVIQHFSHQHPLELSNFQQALAPSACVGCRLRASGWTYACKACSYVLHITCAQMPQFINHPADSSHTLALLAVPAYPEGFFNCDACGQKGVGFSYHCRTCSLDIHTLYASMPLSVTHQAQPHHPLPLTFFSPYQNKGFSCDICENTGTSHWLYRCAGCEFDVHPACATAKPRQQGPQTQNYQTQQPRVGAPDIIYRPVPAYNSWKNSLFNPFDWSRWRRNSEQRAQPTYHDIDLPFPHSLLAKTFLEGRELKCCYRASIDGFAATSFHNNCDFKGPCVVVGYTATTSFKFGGFNPEGYRSTDDYYDTFDAFLFYWEGTSCTDGGDAGGGDLPIILPKVGGSGAALFDYARGGPQFGADGLLIGPPLTPVMGVFTGPDASSGVGDLRQARSRLGLSYAKRPDGKESLFGDESRATLAEVQVFCSPQIASLY